MELRWLVPIADWKERLREAVDSEPAAAFDAFRELANSRMDFVRTGWLDTAVQRYVREHGQPQDWTNIKLALMGSSTLGHLHAGIRIGALRRGILLEIYQHDYGMYQQDIINTSSPLYDFRPELVCLIFDAHHLAGGLRASADQVLGQLKLLWSTLRSAFGCTVVQQTVLPVFWPLAGNQEDRVSDAPASIVQSINQRLRAETESAGVYLLTVDTWAAQGGISQWYDPALWFRSKQEIHPRASVLFGDQIGRMLAALKGLSAKCLVLDLDNTLWGGVVGDDGLEGIVLGQGSTVGEAHLAFQQYSLQLSRRGVILAVCSKNDERNALAPFEQHDGMVLRRDDIACFVANWQDKATNLKRIAESLSIGLDALVFVDDNPAERALIRRELPMVHVPEMPEDVTEYVEVLASAGYFESLDVTADDRQRTAAYRANAERFLLRRSATDMQGYLQALGMELSWQPFTRSGLQRNVQLANKTNQFNLTTRRYSEAEVLDCMNDPGYLTLQLRLVDTYGDNGVIGLVLARHDSHGVLEIETWLMSCRVLGRRIEEATLSIIAEQATRLGCTTLLGKYKPSTKNAMVRQHYSSLGFILLSEEADGTTRWLLSLETYSAPLLPIRMLEGDLCKTNISIAA